LPRSVVWQITRRCNFKCEHCFTSTHRKSGKLDRELNNKEAISLIDCLSKQRVKVIEITGGEPTLRPDTPDILQYAVNRGMKISLVTNASLTPQLLKVLSYVSWLGISCDIYHVKPQRRERLEAIKKSLRDIFAKRPKIRLTIESSVGNVFDASGRKWSRSEIIAYLTLLIKEILESSPDFSNPLVWKFIRFIHTESMPQEQARFIMSDKSYRNIIEKIAGGFQGEQRVKFANFDEK
jgi:organic radical activating enzyme